MQGFIKDYYVWIYVGFLALLSCIAFCTYAIDKGKAKRGAWRVPEHVLLSLSFFGGAVGGYLAMYAVRHKTKKWYFHFVNLLGLAWQVGVLVYMLAV